MTPWRKRSVRGNHSAATAGPIDRDVREIAMIRSILSTCAFAFALVSTSFAADMPAGGRYQEAVFGPAFGWGGVYVGLNAGHGWGALRTGAAAAGPAR